MFGWSGGEHAARGMSSCTSRPNWAVYGSVLMRGALHSRLKQGGLLFGFGSKSIEDDGALRSAARVDCKCVALGIKSKLFCPARRRHKSMVTVFLGVAGNGFDIGWRQAPILP